MRTIITILVTALSLHVTAQQVTGNVKDADGNPLSGATVTLLRDSAIVKLGVTNAKGFYTFSSVKPGTYRVRSSFIGYKNSVSAPFAVAADAVKVPDQQLVKAGGQLKEVALTSQKPIVEVKADKMIVNVEGTINSVGSDALELLRRSPAVTIDKDDNISMSGKNGVQVYIDGRQTPLAGQDLANYLKSLQSSNIEAIELITNPSAKYDAAGNAGIINIRLKKNKSFGTNGSVNAGFNEGITPKYNAGFTINYRNKKINLFGNYGYNKSSNDARLNLDRTVADTNFSQKGAISFKNKSHNFKGGADYFIDKKNTLGVIVNGTFADPRVNNYGYTTITYVPTNRVDRVLIANNTNALKRHNVNFNLNYSYINPNGKNLTLNADHGTYKLSSDQYQPNYYYDPSGQNFKNSEIYELIAPTTININSFKADWEQNYAKGKLGIGGKTAFIKTNNDFQFYDVTPSGNQFNKDNSNTFAYKENINAGYVNYNRQFKGLMIQAGVRIENTTTEGNSIGLTKNAGVYTKFDSTFKRDYTDVFPSGAITFNKNPKSQLNFTYSRRIDRPAYQDLNPFEFRLDAYTYMKGNINLRPQYTNSFGVTHTYMYKLNTTLNYSHIKDLFVQLPDVANVSRAVLSKKNLATQDIVSLNISYPYQHKSYSLFANMNGNYSKYKADLGPNRKIDLDAVGASLFMQNTLKFAKTFTAELSGFYNSPTIYQGSFKAKALWNIDAGLQKQVMKGRGTLKASVSDVFNSLKFRGHTEFAGQVASFTQKGETRMLKLNFVYRFGSNQVKGARQRALGAEEENKRTQQSGGIGQQ
jgi:iron complex outermembrane receptor protein